MVDRGQLDAPAQADAHEASPRPEILFGKEGLDLYARLCDDAVHAPAQSRAWVESWVHNCKPDYFVAALVCDAGPLFALALETAAYGPLRVARFCGDHHANGNFPAARRDYLSSARPADMRALATALHKVRPDVDLLLLERQAEALESFRNPLSHLPSKRSPNIALAADISDGFNAVLARKNGARKRKKHRYRERKFEAAGGFRRVEAKTDEDVDRMLAAFFEMKSDWFRKMGIPDVFGSACVRAFFRDLFIGSLRQDSPRFVLHGLEIGGALRAITGSTYHGKRMVCDFAGFAADEHAVNGPGEFLLFENIADACAQDFSIYDLGVGDEPYKRSWCEIEIPHFDTLLPLTPSGRLLAGWLTGISRAKTVVKQSPLAWRMAMQARKVVGRS